MQTNMITLLIILSLLLLVLLHVNANGNEFFHEERDSLIQLRDSLSSISNLHSNWTGPPCHKDQTRWLGITCSNSHVTGIDLQDIELTGTLQSTSFQNITFLTNLSLGNNALHGDLPTLKGLLHLSVVSLANNRFSGSIPIEYASLSNMSRLELQDNLLNGSIPLFKQPSLVVFNVSYNFLQGKIPQTSVLQRFPSTSFDNNLELCGSPLNKPCNVTSQTQDQNHPVSSSNLAPSNSSPSPSASSNTKSLKVWSLALIVMAAVILPILVIICILCYKRRHKKPIKLGYNPVESASKEQIRSTKKTMNVELEFFDRERQVFDLDELLRSSAEMIGKGKLGITYKARMQSGSIMVVKRLKGVNGVTRHEFVHQMQLLGRLKHENLVQIITYYYSNEEKLVICEHVPNGSLFQLLHGHEGEGKVYLNWEARKNIIKGISRGMVYLHQSLPYDNIPHGNLKSSNVLIYHNNSYPYFNPKLTDFGMQLLVGTAYTRKLAVGKSPEVSNNKGEIGDQLTVKADVFCFGIVLLEVITGKVLSENEEEVFEWLKMISDNKWSTEILDSELVVEKEKHMEMFKFVGIGLECVELEPDERPLMSEVMRRMEEKDHEEITMWM